MGREEGSEWGTCVYLWQIHVDTWQNQYNILKLKKKKECIYSKRKNRIFSIMDDIEYSYL